MKITSTIVFIILSGFLQSQTLTQLLNEPVVGDTNKNYPVDTSAYSNGLPVNISGNGVLWNFSDLGVSSKIASRPYLESSAVSSASNYPACSVVLDNQIGFVYMKSVKTPSAQTEVLGMTISSLSLTMTFTNSAISNKYPFSYGATYTDNISGHFAYTFTGTCSGSITSKADGAGILQLPNGLTYYNVLRVKSVQTLALFSGFFPLGNIRNTVYDYYHSSQKFPVLSVNYQAITMGIGTPTVTGVVSGNSRALLAGIYELNNLNEYANFYPNPCNEFVELDINEALDPYEISLTGLDGQLLFSDDFKKRISTSDLKPGVYLIQINTKEGILRKRLIVNR
jgi:hypothetical protein